MAQRRKCSPELVENDKARLATFKRRSQDLLKEASELSTLCGADVAVLIYADHLSDGPLVYPPESVESLRIIKKWKENLRCIPAAETKPDNFLNQANDGFGPSDDDIESLNSDELNSLLRILEAKEAEVVEKIDAMEKSNIMDDKTGSRD